MINNLINYSILFVILVILQVTIFNDIQLSGYINPYFYLLFIVLLPFDTPGWAMLLSSFLLGLSVDLFMFSYGMHTMACVLIAYLRPRILKGISPRDGYDSGSLPRIHYFGLRWFTLYAFILVAIHHFLLFYLEMFRFADFFHTFLRALLSTIFTVIFIVISQYFIYRK